MEYCENGDLQHLLEELCVLRIESNTGTFPKKTYGGSLDVLPKRHLCKKKERKTLMLRTKQLGLIPLLISTSSLETVSDLLMVDPVSIWMFCPTVLIIVSIDRQ
jgi:hypothetical protein